MQFFDKFLGNTNTETIEPKTTYNLFNQSDKAQQQYIPWIEKYRPQKISELVQDTYIIRLLEDIVRTNDMPHLIFYGPPGTGKTSAILALGRALFHDQFSERVIEFNASDDRGIKAVREKITTHAKKYVTYETTSNKKELPSFKIIILDEADSMTSDAQDALRVIIEEYSTVTRFCFICNYITKISQAIKSRCFSVNFKSPGREEMKQRLINIAKTEKIKGIPNTIFDEILNVSNGDMRGAIMILQNLKYDADKIRIYNTPFSELAIKDLVFISNIVPHMDIRDKYDDKIDKKLIYHSAAMITAEEAIEIIKKTNASHNIRDIRNICRKVVNTGQPVDNIIFQICEQVMMHNDIMDDDKCKICLLVGQELSRLKDNADGYLQLLLLLMNISEIKFITKKRSNKN